MCGIVGYIGGEQAAPILLEELSRLEYRGYDSAGVAVFDGQTGSLAVRKAKGRLQVLSDQLHGGADLDSTAGVGRSGKIAVVHNGIIENYAELKAFLMNQGVSFTSETDAEVVAQLTSTSTTATCSRPWAGCSTESREPTPWASCAPTVPTRSSPSERTAR